MGQLGGGRFYETYDEKMCGYPSVLFSFLESALKRRPRVTETEIKQVMSAQLKTRLAVRCSGRMMAEKMIDWETHVQL